MYDPVTYWNHREHPNNAIPEDTVKHLTYVHSQVSECSTILDFGAGVGRMFPAYVFANHVECYDISDKYKDRLMDTATMFNFTINHTVEKEIKTLPYGDNQFDVAVAVSVLLHQKPQDLDGILIELARVAKKVVVVTWEEPNLPEKAMTLICFNYDYRERLRNLNLYLHNYTTGKVNHDNYHQSYFVYSEDEL